MRLAAVLLSAAALSAEPRIVYQKAFPGSTPAWVEITLERDGKGVYKESPDDDQPIKFAMPKAQVDEVYGLAEKLGHFKTPLESGLPVAKMGLKKFRWEDGAAKSEVEFNYSQDENARSLQDWFEKMTDTQQIYIAVERAVKFDKLGANKALLQMHALMDKGRLIGGAHFIPLLERVVKNDTYLNMARERAGLLLEAVKKQ